MDARLPEAAGYHDEGQMAYHSKSEEKQTAHDLRAGNRDDWECEAAPWEEGPDGFVVFAGPHQGRVWSRLLHHRHRVCLQNLPVLCVRGEVQTARKAWSAHHIHGVTVTRVNIHIDNDLESHAYHMMKTRTASCCGQK